MPPPTRTAALCLAVAVCSPGHAQQPGGRTDRLRVDLAYVNSATTLETSFGTTDDGTVSETTFGAGFTAQLAGGFYARARVRRVDVDEFESDFRGEIDPDLSYTSGTLGIGHRFSGHGDGPYWGVGLRGSAAEDRSASGTALIFREKDTARRHGVVAFGYTAGDDELEAFSLTGRHVWFGADSWIGPGVIWSVTRGSAIVDFGAEADLTGVGLGVVLVFRERS